MSERLSDPIETPADTGQTKPKPRENGPTTEDNEVKNSSLAKIFDYINVKKIGENIKARPDRIKVKGRPNRDNFEVSQISEAENLEDEETFYAGSKKQNAEGGGDSDGGSGGGGGGDSDDGEGTVDWDEEVGDDDIRYVLAADKAVEFILEARASAIKPGYEELKKLVDYADSLKMILILLITVFVLLGRPIWCSNLGSQINWECTQSQNPENPISYRKSNLPVLSASTKRVVLIICMIGIFLLDLVKIIITRGDKVKRVSFYFCMFILACYSMGFYLSKSYFCTISF